MAQTTNPDSPADSPATDFEGLRQEGILLLQQLAGAAWTDHNDHDPGITILEQLCYALTDLGYRIDYDIPDLLASSGDPARDLYSPGKVLSSEPVTFLYQAAPDKGRSVGFIAEDVPDLVASHDRRTISPMEIVAVLTRVVKDLKERLEALEGRPATE
jgi:hypothetical protein